MELKGEKKRGGEAIAIWEEDMGTYVLRLCKYACLILIILGKDELRWHHMGMIATL